MSSKPAAPSEATHGRRVDPLGARRPQRGGAHSGNYAAVHRAHAYGSAVGSADELLAEAAAHPTSGWDFTWLGDRMRSDGVPWDYPAIVEEAAAGATSALDMGTGGGEFLSGVTSLPRRTVATEGWQPNVRVAAARLSHRAIPVVHDEGAIDNVDQSERSPRGRLAFRDGAFDLVLNRHEAYAPAEVRRVLRPGGRFLTQQADSAGADARALLGLEPSGKTLFDRKIATTQLEAVGLTVRGGNSASRRCDSPTSERSRGT